MGIGKNSVALSRDRLISAERATPASREGVSKLVSALSPVNHKGLHQDWTQIHYLQGIPFTSHNTTGHVFEPIYILRALNTVTCIRQGDLFYSAGLHRNHVLTTANTGEIGRGFGKMQVNGPEG